MYCKQVKKSPPCRTKLSFSYTSYLENGALEGVRNVLLTVTVLARGRADVQQEDTVLNVLLIVTVLERVRTVVGEDPV